MTYAVGGSWIGHGVAAVSVGDELEDERTLACGCPFLAVLDGGHDGEDVHAVDL